METKLVPTISLSIHSALKDLPEWADDDPQFEALCRDIHERGIDYPLKAVGNKVADGRHRLRAARKVKLENVPVDQVAEADVPSLVVRSLTQRRHYTKSALAFMLLRILQDGRNKTIALISEETSISTRLLEYAIEVRDIFHENGDLGAEYRVLMEPKILAGEVSLGQVSAGWGGFRSTKRVPKKKTNQLQLWDRSLSDFQKRFASWDKFDVGAKNTVVAKFQTVFEEMPHELLLKLSQKISHEVKHRKKEDK
jgi:hypothetical protein